MFTKRLIHTTVLTALVVLLVCGSVTSSSMLWEPNNLVLKMESGYDIETVNSQFGTEVAQHLRQTDVYLMSVTGVDDLDSLAGAIQALPEVRFCHPNYAIDPLQPVQSSLPVSDEQYQGTYTDQEACQRLNLYTAHELSLGTGVLIGVLDGGVDYNHTVLSPFTSSGYDYIDDDYDAIDEGGGPASGHGTFVAGVTHLMAPEANINAYRVSDTSGLGNGYMVAEAILQAVEDGCRIVNLSLVTTDVHQAIAEAAAYAAGQGVLIVAAAGNGYDDAAHYPASDPNVLSVAAVDTLDLLADFSSYGEHVDVCAPGTHIYSPYLNNGYAWWGGTSFAAPFVAAQAALLWDYKPEATLEEIIDAILSTAISLDHLNPDLTGQMGAGLINPLGSIIAIRGGAFALHVPSEYATIQAAIEASLDGDTILVAAGEYWESVNLYGHTIVLMSELGPEHTILHPDGIERYIIETYGNFVGQPKVSGFTFTGVNGNHAIIDHGIGVHITDNVFLENNVGLEGLACIASYGCRIERNLFVRNGGACIVERCSLTGATGIIKWVTNNTFADNRIAVHLDNQWNLDEPLIYVSILNNIMAGCSEYAISTHGSSGPQAAEVAYNLLWDNTADLKEGLVVDSSLQLFANPIFVNTVVEDFRILPGSPAVDAGHPDPLYNDADGSRNDIGAYPLTSIALPVASDFSIVVRNTLTPTFIWSYFDVDATGQYQYEIEVGDDNDWVAAELWASGPVVSADTTVVYSGSVLQEFATYYARIRVHNGTEWGQWLFAELVSYEAPSIQVPSGIASIQQAADLAEPGDTVFIAAGTYQEELTLDCNGVVLVSSDGPEVTVIEPEGTAPIIVSVNDADSVLELNGLTFSGGDLAIVAKPASNLIIRDCRITNCSSYGIKGLVVESLTVVGTELSNCNRAFECQQGAIRFDSNLVVDNYTAVGHYTTYFRGISLVARNNVFARNESECALYASECFETEIRNNTIYGTSNVGLYAKVDGIVTNNLTAFNVGNGIELSAYSGDGFFVGYNNSFGNLGADRLGFIWQNPGGISLDPLFEDTTGNEFSLQLGSPCIDTGNPDTLYNDPDGTRSDIGAVQGPPVEQPVALDFVYGPVDGFGDVTSFTPSISWAYNDSSGSMQQQYHIQIGNDADWSGAEMWDTGPVMSSDNITVYAGTTLENWTWYHIRIRVSNGIDWGSWYAGSFYVRTSHVAEVPGHFMLIQNAINVVRPGDSVLVDPGTYNQSINFGGKAIVVTSTSGKDSTFLMGDGSDNIVTLQGGEDSSTILRGFTIKFAPESAVYTENAAVSILNCDILRCHGTGVRIENSNGPAVIRNCLIERCDYPEGGGVRFKSSSGIIEYCNILHNYASSRGGGIFVHGSSNVIIRYNTICDNSTDGMGGGLYVFDGDDFRIYNNTFYDNQVHTSDPSTSPVSGAAIYTYTDGNVDVRNNIIVENGPGVGIMSPQVYEGHLYEYNDVYLNTDSNYCYVVPGIGTISADPMFVDPVSDDFHLMAGSPCIDAGDPSPGYNDSDGTRNDMGAFPFSIAMPGAAALNLGDQAPERVTTCLPTFYWSFVDTLGIQQACELQVATDVTNWQNTMVWESGQVNSPDTLMTYAGSALDNGGDYVVRVRVSNGISWGGWSVMAFHINGIPDTPVQAFPVFTDVVGPVAHLTTERSFDAEGDTVRYEFELTESTDFTTLFFASGTVMDTTVNIPDTLTIGQLYRWRIRAGDGDTCSPWAIDSFTCVELAGRVDLIPLDDTVICGRSYTVVLPFENNTPYPAMQISNGFKIYSPDGASIGPATARWAEDGTDWHSLFDFSCVNNVHHGTETDTVVFYAKVGTSGTGLPPGRISHAWEVTIPVYCEDEGRTICVEKADHFHPSLEWAWYFDTGEEEWHAGVPSWTGSYCFTIGGCCEGNSGDVDFNLGVDVDIADIVYLVDYMFTSGPPPPCFDEANVDAQGEIDIGDLVYIVDYAFTNGPEPLPCP